MRCFIGIPTADIMGQLGNLYDVFSHFSNIKIIRKEDVHLTLFFLGEVNSKSVIEALKKINFEQFVIESSKTIFLPSKENPRVYCLEFHDSPQLKELRRKIFDALDVNKAFGEKEFKAHITLVRLKKKTPLPEINTNIKINVSRFVLYSSKLTSQGSVYEVVAEFKAEPL